jgi:3-oxoadipate enol-lactonase
MLPALRDRYRVLRYDNRGYGRSPVPSKAFTWFDDLRLVLDRAELAAAALVAHSGGGGTALGFALAAPERVSSIVLMAPGVPDYPWREDDPYMLEFGRRHAANDREGLIELGLRTWAPAGSDPAARAQVSSAVAAFYATSALNDAEPPVYDGLARITAPSVIVRGDLEYPMVAEASELIAARIPGCRTIVIPGADHLLPLRTPAELTEIILAHVG